MGVVRLSNQETCVKSLISLTPPSIFGQAVLESEIDAAVSYCVHNQVIGV